MVSSKNNSAEPKDIFDVEFEKEVKHNKGILTEDSVIGRLTILAKSAKSEILRRVEPPFFSGVGECDSIFFHDSGIYLIEIKRYGGVIKNINENLKSISIDQGKKEIKIENPVNRLLEKCKKLSDHISSQGEWYQVNRYSKFGGLGSRIPVYPVLCFGPSTEIIKNDNDPDKVLICNSRNIGSRLSEFMVSKNNVIGLSQLAKKASINWTVQGKLKIKRRAGFLRCYPQRAFGKTTVFDGLTNISGSKTGRITLTYDDKIPKTTKDIESIVFKYNNNGRWERTLLNAKSDFVWSSGRKK